jgi:hypothetical protein
LIYLKGYNLDRNYKRAVKLGVHLLTRRIQDRFQFGMGCPRMPN